MVGSGLDGDVMVMVMVVVMVMWLCVRAVLGDGWECCGEGEGEGELGWVVQGCCEGGV